MDRTELRAEYRVWRESVPLLLRRDPLWRLTAYRLARFVADRGWRDVRRLARDPRTRLVAAQLCRALGSICANIAEGYSRSSGPDRVRMFEYALGSARESRDWYLQGRAVIGEQSMQVGVELLCRIVMLLLTYIPDQRSIKVTRQRRKRRTTDRTAEGPDVSHLASRISNQREPSTPRP